MKNTIEDGVDRVLAEEAGSVAIPLDPMETSFDHALVIAMESRPGIEAVFPDIEV